MSQSDLNQSNTNQKPLAADDASAAAAPPRRKSPAAGLVTWTALAMMTVSSVASLRPAPTMAIYGLACVFLYVLPAIVFLVPAAMVSPSWLRVGRAAFTSG